MVAIREALDRHGFAVLPGLLGTERVDGLRSDLDRTLARASGSVLQSRGQVYGVRNLIDVWPLALTVAQDPTLHEALSAVLGNGLGLVRSIFFDKPPGRTWSLPWHRDLTIAVREVGRAEDLAALAHAVHMQAGDALLIRPLVLHRSGPSTAGTRRHRRTLHFEFAGALALPGGLEWYRFIEPIGPPS